MLQVNCFHTRCCYFYGFQLWDFSSNYIEQDIYVALQKAIGRIFNLNYNTKRCLLPFGVGSPHIRVNLVNRFNDFFNALVSSVYNSNELLVYNCHFSNTPLGFNRKFMNMYNCNKCNSRRSRRSLWDTASVIIGCSIYKLVCPSFRTMRLNVWLIMFVSIDLDILWWCIF